MITKASARTRGHLTPFYSTSDAGLLLFRPPTNGLVCYLAPDTPGSGTQWADQSGYGNHGTLVNGATWGSGEITLDGTNDYIRIADSMTLRGMAGLTICAWIRKGTADIKPVGWWPNHYIFRESGGVLQFYASTTGDSSISGDSSSAGAHFYCAQYDGANMRIYKDASLVVGPTAKTGAIGNSPGGALYLGAEYDGADSQDGGYIRFLMYNRGLNESEIAALHNGFS